MTNPRHVSMSALVGALAFIPVAAFAQPVDPQAQLRETARAVEDCAKRSCPADEMQQRLAALKSAQAAFEASLTPNDPEPDDSGVVESEEPTEPIVEAEVPDPEPEPPAVEPWLPPPAYRPGATPIAPPDLGEGRVKLQRQHLGNYWVGLGMTAGGGLGLIVSAAYIGANAEGAKEFGDVGAGVVLSVVNLTVLIVGGVLFSNRGELVPDTSAMVAPGRDGVVIRF